MTGRVIVSIGQPTDCVPRLAMTNAAWASMIGVVQTGLAMAESVSAFAMTTE